MSAQPVEVTMDAPRVTIHVGDCRDVLKTLPAQSVHCVVTSPPYFGLRDYGSGQWEGGDPSCEHQVRTPGAVAKSQASSTLTSTSREVVGHTKEGYRDVCPRCGARRVDRQIGLEADVAAYVTALMDVFAEVWRVLRDDGSFFLNLGDSYAGSGKGPTGKHGVGHHEQRQGFHTPGRAAGVIRAKSMMCIPERILIALSDAGWIVRDKIVWHKLAPMPSSATDRCTGAWEPVYHLTKQQRYYADMEAVREPYQDATLSRNKYARNAAEPNKDGQAGYLSSRRNTEEVFIEANPAGANLRNVWSLSPAPFDSSALGVDVDHYAMFPPELARRCVAIGTSERGCCAKCGKPWTRTTEAEVIPSPGGGSLATAGGAETSPTSIFRTKMVTVQRPTGWQPSCQCDGRLIRRKVEPGRYVVDYTPHAAMPEPVPATVLDPFAGAGTTLLVANRLGRHAIGIELNPSYARLEEARIRADAGMFANVEVIE